MRRTILISSLFALFLTQERVAGRMIRAVNIGMGIGTAAVEILDGPQRLGLSGVTAAVMAGIAHAWHGHLQELRVVAAVGLVAIRAVFHDWRVFPEEGAAPFRVAAQAILVNGALNELAGIG